MNFDSFQLWLLVGGAAFGLLGLLVVFSGEFISMLERTMWKKAGVDEAICPGQGARIFNRYGTGLGCLILGVGMLALFVQTLWK